MSARSIAGARSCPMFPFSLPREPGSALGDAMIRAEAISRSPMGLYVGRSEPRLYDRAVEQFRSRHYNPRTQKAYLHWMRRFIEFPYGRHPRTLSETHVNAFLTALAVTHNVAPSTQDKALAAVLFLYEHALGQPLDRVDGVVVPDLLPVVLTRAEVAAVFASLEGVPKVVCMLHCGSGLCLADALSLRVKDFEFKRGEILVRDGKGAADRVTMLPSAIAPMLQDQLRSARRQHQGRTARAG